MLKQLGRDIPTLLEEPHRSRMLDAANDCTGPQLILPRWSAWIATEADEDRSLLQLLFLTLIDRLEPVSAG